MQRSKYKKIVKLIVIIAIAFTSLFLDTHSSLATSEFSSMPISISAKTDTSTQSSDQSSDQSSKDKNAVETTFFGNVEDDGKGCGVYEILNLILEILTYGIAIAATIGIVISGITYLTAKGNEAQVAKSKRRIFEIVLGLALYAVLWVIISFLLPGGALNNDPNCGRAKSAPSLFDSRPVTIKDTGNFSSSKKTTTSNKKLRTADKIVATARAFAWPSEGNKHVSHSYGDSRCFSSYNSFGTAKPTKAYYEALKKQKKKSNLCGRSGYGADCGVFVTTVVRSSGKFKMKYGQFESYFENSKGWKRVSSKKAKAGDVCGGPHGGGFHTKIYLGKGKIAEAEHHGNKFPHIQKGNCKNEKYTFRAVK